MQKHLSSLAWRPNGFQMMIAIASLAIATFFSFSIFAQDITVKREVQPSINAELKEHTKHFERKIYKIADNVYSAVGFDLANTILVEGDKGVIIVDTGNSVNAAREVEKELRKITTKPAVAVVYTHFHPDHINGVKAYASEEDVKAGKI